MSESEKVYSKIELLVKCTRSLSVNLETYVNCGFKYVGEVIMIKLSENDQYSEYKCYNLQQIDKIRIYN